MGIQSTGWRMVGPRADKIITAAIFIYVTPIAAYNITNLALRPSGYAATKQFPGMEFAWLRIPCKDHWLGFKAVHGVGKDERAHAMVCLTAGGWTVIPSDSDPSTPSR